MLYLICLLFTCISSFSFAEEEREDLLALSTPEEIATLTAGQEFLVGGVISPLSGSPVLHQTDLIAKGAQSVSLTRYYLGPYIPTAFNHILEKDRLYLAKHLERTYRGWRYFLQSRIQVSNGNPALVRLCEPNGLTLDFRVTKNGIPNAELVGDDFGISNFSPDLPSGQFDPRNIKILLLEDGHYVIVYSPDGTIRHYRSRLPTFIRGKLCYLEKEILPNGKVLRYNWAENNFLSSIDSFDPQERYIYASLAITYSSPNIYFTSSDGNSTTYQYEIKSEYHQWKERRIQFGKKCVFPPLLKSVSSPYFRNEKIDYDTHFLLQAYSGKDQIFNCLIGEVKNPSSEGNHFRVSQLLLPVGNQDAFLPAHEFHYTPPNPGKRGGTTYIRHLDGTGTTYFFAPNLLLTAIQYFGKEGQLVKQQNYTYNDRNWLEANILTDGQNHLLYSRTFQYDRFGNPIVETFSGDLTGDGIQNNYIIRRTFSDDGRNLLLREETEDGKVVCFSYLPYTNLLTAKLTKENERILLREFNIYDDCYNLIQTISDDGATEDKDNLSCVTQRTLTTYFLRQTTPFLHMPEWVEESYWEAGIEKLLKKRHLIYDPHGNIAQEEVHNAEGNLRYTLHKSYNERGDLLSETNPLGQQATYTYDSRGRLETSLNFSHRLHTTFRHDIKGRLRELAQKGDDGIIHIHSSDYDFQDRLINKIDPFQNSTYYTYDPVINKVIKTNYPPIVSLDEKPVAVSTHSTYDPLGRELTHTDPNGNTTTYRYNIYGSPSEIQYPNGGREVFRYTKNGQLISHTNSDNLTIHYKNDLLGRVLCKTYLSTEGKALAKETFTYNGFNLLSETNKEGYIKNYSYDGAGRKIREKYYNQVTEFSYDSLGQLCTICKHNGNDPLFIHYKRDLEGRILEEQKTDISGKLLYKIHFSYDAAGNQETTTRFINGKEAVDSFTYDSFSRLLEHRDAEGFVTQTTYNENYINSLGQRVLQTIITDPHQTTRIETQDAFGHTIRKEVLNPQKSIIACQEFTHDPHGNLTYQKDHVYETNQFKTTQTIQYTYTPDHRIASLTRAFGTNEPRRTTYTYLPSGKTATKTLPDGVTLIYSYHPLGFLSRLDSSDDKIHHAFKYTLLGHLRYASDENHDITIKREIDPFGNVLQEVFPHGFEVRKDYDNLNRLVSLKMGDHAEVLYTYDPLFLRRVTKISSTGEILYEHSYEDYDEDGNLISENLIGNLGQITHVTNVRDQKTSISSPYFSEKCKYDPVGNLISNTVDGVESRYSYDDLSQLSSENSENHSLTYSYDSLYNRTQKNSVAQKVNELNELLSLANRRYTYDLNGNQTLRQTPSETFHFTYDPLHRLIQASSEKQKIDFVYDPLGRRLSKTIFNRAAYGWKETTREHYLYHGQNEIGAFTSPDHAKNLRVLGLNSATVAVEMESQVAAPLIDVQGNIRRLIDLAAKTAISLHDFTVFGEEQQINSLSPWRFASKRLDPELGLIYFGKRYYDPLSGRWLTIDPAGFIDSVNLYQYAFNNPFRYRDPDGKFIIALPLLALTWKVVAAAAVTALIAYELEHQHKHSNSTFARSFNSAVHQVVQNIGGVSQYVLNQKLSMEKKQIDERLPNDPDELLNDPDWEETSHSDAKEKGHRTFENKKTGEKLRYDAGKPGTTGHKAQDHWHRFNPDKTSKLDEYLDANDNPVPEHSDASHLYSS